MDPKRKRLYIIIIIICVLLVVGILWWGQSGSSPAPAPVSTSSSASATSASGGSTPDLKKDASGNYSAPSVFPDNKELDTSVLNFSTFKILMPYQPAVVNSAQLGRDDPFATY